MRRIEMLMQVTAILRPVEGWVCRGLSDTKVRMEHPTEGKRTAILVDGRKMVVRPKKDRLAANSLLAVKLAGQEARTGAYPRKAPDGLDHQHAMAWLRGWDACQTQQERASDGSNAPLETRRRCLLPYACGEEWCDCDPAVVTDAAKNTGLLVNYSTPELTAAFWEGTL